MKLKYKANFLLICLLSLTTLDANEANIPLCSNEKCVMNDSDKNILKALDHLEKAYSISQSIKNEEIRMAVSSHFKACLDCLKQDFLLKNYENASEKALALYENLDEILADCQDMHVKDKISFCINDMINDIGSL